MGLDFSIESKCSHCGHIEYESFNITHNLGRMAAEAGVYKCLWRPEENGYDLTSEVVPILKEGIRLLEHDPEHFRALGSPNGWGTYDDFLRFLQSVLTACEINPDFVIKVSR